MASLVPFGPGRFAGVAERDFDAARLGLAAATRSEQRKPGTAVAERAHRTQVRGVGVKGADTEHPRHIGGRLYRTAFVAGRSDDAQIMRVRRLNIALKRLEFVAGGLGARAEAEIHDRHRHRATQLLAVGDRNRILRESKRSLSRGQRLEVVHAHAGGSEADHPPSVRGSGGDHRHVGAVPVRMPARQRRVQGGEFIFGVRVRRQRIAARQDRRRVRIGIHSRVHETHDSRGRWRRCVLQEERIGGGLLHRSGGHAYLGGRRRAKRCGAERDCGSDDPGRGAPHNQEDRTPTGRGQRQPAAGGWDMGCFIVARAGRFPPSFFRAGAASVRNRTRD